MTIPFIHDHNDQTKANNFIYTFPAAGGWGVHGFSLCFSFQKKQE